MGLPAHESAAAVPTYFAPITLYGDIDGGHFGAFITNGGDINNDGRDDLIISAPQTAFNSPAAVYVYSAFNGQLIHRIDGVSRNGFGQAISTAGDVDDDGKVDFILGVRGAGGIGDSEGRALIYSGDDASLIRTLFGNPLIEASYGQSVAYVPGGSGFGSGPYHVIAGNDFGGQTAATHRGSTRIYNAISGESDLADGFISSPTAEGADMTVAPAGDVDGDGFNDYIMASPRSNVGEPSGRVRIISSSGDVLRDLVAPSSEMTPIDRGRLDTFGTSAINVGDVNGDGRPDMIVGANGAAMMYSGLDGILLWDIENSAFTDIQQIGRSFAALSDINGDGVPDVIAHTTRPGSGDENSVALILSGATGEELLQIEGEESTLRFPSFSKVASLGDLNGDGVDDFAMGSDVAGPGVTTRGIVQIYMSLITGDMNGDGLFDGLDIDPFIQALTDPAGYAADFGDIDPVLHGDFNSDDVFDNLDIFGFVSALNANGTPTAEIEALLAVPEPSAAVLLGLGGLLLVRRRSAA